MMVKIGGKTEVNNYEKTGNREVKENGKWIKGVCNGELVVGILQQKKRGKKMLIKKN